ncbi:ribonuclease H-like domain-containing protein, partial [Tanacetum coccineum]
MPLTKAKRYYYYIVIFLLSLQDLVGINNTSASRPIVNGAKPSSNVFHKLHSLVRRTFNQRPSAKNSDLKETGNTAKVNNITTIGPKAAVSAAKGKRDNAIKSSACWIWTPKRNGNPQYALQDQGSSKRGKITRKVKIRTGKLDFEDVYFVKELKFNLFSVLQMCDKKNSVLFTETECLVLSPDFKLLDESQVLLKVPRQNNMYSFNINNVVPLGGLTCLFAKDTIDESNLWHRRLGHINFKTINKLVRGNLVRDLPSKLFENDHTCVACQKGKQHKASCLVGCDNGNEFKNNEMNQFCQMKGIKREFSVARTPQQNGVAERKNKTLIEAVRTMLADSLLPTTFWAKAINTACYVQNRVLITKPHNKTPYELLVGRSPNLDFMRPFECPVTILNTLDHLGKFEGKADEGFLVGYSINKSNVEENLHIKFLENKYQGKAFRVFNSRTKKVEENLHIKFLENKSNVAGSGPEWLFDIDSLTKSMNYESVTAGNQTNDDAGIETNINAGQAGHEKVSDHEYILLPFMPSDSPLSSSNQNSEDKDADDEPGKGDEGLDQERTDSSTQDINIAGPSINTASTNINTGSLNINIVSSNDPSMPSLEETGIFDEAYDDEDMGTKSYLNNLETTINVNHIPT